MIKELLIILVSSSLISNVVLSQFLGLCPFLGVSKKTNTAAGMGTAVIFVITLSSAVTGLIYQYILTPLDLTYLQTIVFILVIAALVQFVEMFLKKYVQGLYQALGVYLPLITTNCAVLGIALTNVQKNYGILYSIVSGFATAAGFLISITILAGIREKMEYNDIPESFKGMPIVMITAGIDISVGSVTALVCMVAANQMENHGASAYTALLMALVIGLLFGLVQGFLVSYLEIQPFIVTLATQLIVYGILLMYIMLNGNNGQPLSGLDKSFKNFVTGSFLKIRGVPIPNYVWYACVVVVFMWFMWNKTTFGKNMFAVGSNPEAANVSGVNVMRTTILVHTLAGCMYGITGFIESARIGSNQANTGLNYECDAIAACVIGGVSFVGGTGKISGVVLGVFLLRIIFVALNFLSINMNMQYVIKGLIILVACAIDMRKYLVRK